MTTQLPKPITDEPLAFLIIHGFRIQSYGKRLSPGFQKGLRWMAECGFGAPTCIVVKTLSGKQSGITHAGDRYVPSDNPYNFEVIQAMRSHGIEPPSPPFRVAPGESTLYHEWGHHVDQTWSRDALDLGFSFRWFSHFHQLNAQPTGDFCTTTDDRCHTQSLLDASNAVGLWLHASRELFANLFEDWMRGDRKIPFDRCEPASLNRHALHLNRSINSAIMPHFLCRRHACCDLSPFPGAAFTLLRYRRQSAMAYSVMIQTRH